MDRKTILLYAALVGVSLVVSSQTGLATHDPTCSPFCLCGHPTPC